MAILQAPLNSIIQATEYLIIKDVIHLSLNNLTNKRIWRLPTATQILERTTEGRISKARNLYSSLHQAENSNTCLRPRKGLWFRLNEPRKGPW